MSLPHQALNGAITWLRPHLPGASSLKSFGAFAGGVACTGVVMAAWTGSLGPMVSDSTQPEPTQIAAVMPPPAAAGAANPGNRQDAATDPKAPDSGATSADAAARVRCEKQVWPYIDQQCLTKAESDTAPSRRVRIVSTDATIASDRTPVPSPKSDAPSQPASSDRTADAAASAASIPVPLSDPRRPGGDTPSLAAGVPPPTLAETTGAIPPPTSANGAPQTANLMAAPEARRSTRSTDAAKRRQRRADERLAQRHHNGDDRLLPRRPDVRDDGLVQPRQQQGRQVTVEQTYRMPYGRRVVMQRVYPVTPEGAFRNSAPSSFRMPFARRQSIAPSALAADD